MIHISSGVPRNVGNRARGGVTGLWRNTHVYSHIPFPLVGKPDQLIRKNAFDATSGNGLASRARGKCAKHIHFLLFALASIRKPLYTIMKNAFQRTSLCGGAR